MTLAPIRNAFLALGLAGCGALTPVHPPPAKVAVIVESDPGRPVANATLHHGGQKLATTGDDGTSRLELKGNDGEAFDIQVTCPEGFQSPAKPIQVVLRRLVDQSKVPQYVVACPPTRRAMVVAIRADGGPNLPVLYLGREVARTDASGAAHLVLRLPPYEEFTLQLSTEEKGSQQLLPKNPARAFIVKEQDAIATFDQKFERERPKFVAAAPPPEPTGPVCLSCEKKK